MKDPHTKSERDNATARCLREFVDALDRRVPHVERLGEVHIAREAAALRAEAAKRLEELCRPQVDAAIREGERSDAVMTDDGGRLPNSGL